MTTPTQPEPVSQPVPPGAALARALSRAQAAMRSVGRDRDVEVKSEKGRYTFSYATLAAIWEVIRVPLASNGLSVVQLPTVDCVNGRVSVETRLLHESGESLASVCELPVVQKTPQGIGSIISYARRYGLSAMLGVVSDEDDDGEGGSPHAAQGSVSMHARPQVSPAASTSPAEFEQQLRSSTSKAELHKVGERIAAARLSDEKAVEHLQSVFRDVQGALP